MKRIILTLISFVLFFAPFVDAKNAEKEAANSYVLIILNKNPYDVSDIT
jgi:hypothetical protein